jgi:L-asparaginase
MSLLLSGKSSSSTISLDDSTHGPIIIKEKGASPTSKNVAVLNTGGTIGMRYNSDGSLEPSVGYLAERMTTMPEFLREEMPGISLFELLPLIDSSDMGPAEWVRIAKMIEALYYSFDAFVLIMGTDTMAYAASALSFICENLSKPVIITGSMLPLCDVINDAQRNLVASIIFSSSFSIPEVCIFMDDTLFRGNRTIKINNNGLDAFDSPNYLPLGKLETSMKIYSNLILPHPRGMFRVHHDFVTNIAVWRMIPGFDDEYIQVAVNNSVHLKGIVLELYGTGNVSSKKKSLLDAIQVAISKGIVVVASSQCLRGSVNLHAYKLGRNLEEIGVISAHDMTTEAIAVKLAYLLSWPGLSSLEQLKVLMNTSLRGEVTELSSNQLMQSNSTRGNEALLVSSQQTITSPSSKPTSFSPQASPIRSAEASAAADVIAANYY